MTKQKIEVSSDICTPCGECCRHFPYIPISEKDINLLIDETGLSKDKFTNMKDIKSGEYFLKFNDNGDCVFFEEKSPTLFSCNVYKARPSICSDYPSSKKQIKYCETERIPKE